jgi:hypothetical protein
VRKVPDGHLPLLVDVGDEGAAIVDAEVENSVLVGCPECDAENGCIRGLCDRGEVQALEGRKHAELKLDVVLGGGDEGSEVVVGVLGDLDLEVLCSLVKAMQ